MSAQSTNSSNTLLTSMRSIRKKTEEIYALRSAQALLGWDQETYMPSRGGEGRAEAMAAMSKVIQEKYCDPKLGEELEQAQADMESGNYSLEEVAIVREMASDREKLLKIPVELTSEMAKVASLSQQAWSEARESGEESIFEPWLKKTVDLMKQKAECLGYQDSPYDALLGEYEPGTSTQEVSEVLSELKGATVSLLNRIKGSTRYAEQQDKNSVVRVLEKPFPVSTQRIFNQKVLQDLTFNLEAGRLDESTHPFTEGVWPGDVRLTTRYHEKDVVGGLFGTIHEGGHGLYEQGFRPEYYGTPVAEAVSLGVHESQSRLWENQVGRSQSFWEHYYPEFSSLFAKSLKTSEGIPLSLGDFLRALNKVEPSFIRVEADEVTYNLHIILRFEIERALIEGSLDIGDVKDAWNQKSKELLGLDPKTASEGYMQDVHWSVGLMGYFPTYSLGNIFSAQLFQKAKLDITDLEEGFGRGKFQPLREWLRENVHQYGRMYMPKELIQKAVGEEPSSKAFVQYLEKKYGELYEL